MSLWSSASSINVHKAYSFFIRLLPGTALERPPGKFDSLEIEIEVLVHERSGSEHWDYLARWWVKLSESKKTIQQLAQSLLTVCPSCSADPQHFLFDEEC